MTKPSIFTLTLAALVLASTLAEAGTPDSIVGKRLSAAELSQYADSPSVQLDTQTFKIMSSGSPVRAASAASSGAVTQVINELGVVGESRNEVIVSQVSVDSARQAAASLTAAPVSADYYGHMNISKLRFASFQEAVNARTQLKKLLPQARVDVPIQYAKPVAR